MQYYDRHPKRTVILAYKIGNEKQKMSSAEKDNKVARMMAEQNRFKYFIGGVCFLYVFLIHKSFGSAKVRTTEAQAQLSTSPPDHCQNDVILNGSFQDGTKGWKFIGESTGMKLVEGRVGNALSTVKRDKWFYGPAQNIDMQCFRKGGLYEVSMDVQLKDYNGNFVTCDPYNRHLGPDTCPVLALKMNGKKVSTKDIALPVGPWKPEGWNQVYGIFEATPDIFKANSLEVYVTKAPEKVNVVIDNVSIKTVSLKSYGISSCKQLIKNEGAEIGDARFWSIKGNGSNGIIDIISPGATGNFAFYHHGERQANFNNMWQHLDQRCLEPGSAWKVSFKMKLLDATGEPTSCDKSQLEGDASCPTVVIESHTPDKGIHTTNLRNEVPGHWEHNEFNLFESTFTVSAQHLAKAETSIFLNNIPSSYSYQLDDFTMTQIASKA